jgi:hypothetical protein
MSHATHSRWVRTLLATLAVVQFASADERSSPKDLVIEVNGYSDGAAAGPMGPDGPAGPAGPPSPQGATGVGVPMLVDSLGQTIGVLDLAHYEVLMRREGRVFRVRLHHRKPTFYQDAGVELAYSTPDCTGEAYWSLGSNYDQWVPAGHVSGNGLYYPGAYVGDITIRSSNYFTGSPPSAVRNCSTFPEPRLWTVASARNESIDSFVPPFHVE